MNTRISAGSLGAAFLVLLVACSGGSSTDAPDPSATDVPSSSLTGDPVRIGLISQEEELFAYPEISVGAETGEAYVNGELGGIDGRPLEVDVCTAGDTPESAVSCAQGFANDTSIKLVINGTLNSLASSPVLVEAGKPVLTIANDTYDQITPGIFAFDPGANGLVVGLVAFAANDLGASTYTLVVPDDPYYTKVIGGLTDSLGAQYDLTPAGETVVLDPTADPTGGMTAAKEQGADVLAVVVEGPMCVPIANSLEALAVTTPVITADVCLGDAVRSGALDGWHAVAGNRAPVDPGFQVDDGVYDEIVTTYGNDDPLLRSALGGWGVGNVIVAADAIVKAGGGDASPQQILEILSDDYTVEVPSFPPVSCPGPGEWVGACMRSTTVLAFADGKVDLETDISFDDMSDMDFLLDG